MVFLIALGYLYVRAKTECEIEQWQRYFSSFFLKHRGSGEVKSLSGTSNLTQSLFAIVSWSITFNQYTQSVFCRRGRRGHDEDFYDPHHISFWYIRAYEVHMYALDLFVQLASWPILSSLCIQLSCRSGFIKNNFVQFGIQLAIQKLQTDLGLLALPKL